MSRRSRKYLPLERYLRAQPGDRLTLTFAELEAILGAALPPGAYGRVFWANMTDAQSQSRAWHAAGWRVASVDIPRRVAFVRREMAP